MRDHDGERGDDNTVSLREYIERIFDEKQKALELAFKAQQDALGLASRTLEVRLEKLNELRREVTEDRAKFVPRETYDAEIGPLQAFRSKALGFGSLLALLSGVVGALIERLLA